MNFDSYRYLLLHFVKWQGRQKGDAEESMTEYSDLPLMEREPVFRKQGQKMTENSNRTEKTKYRLANSIGECMKTIPVDKITVQNIVDGCGMARQTFYRNFKDKYDLINWYFDKLVLESFAQIGVDKTVCQSLKEKFEFIQKEKVFFTEAFRSDDYNSLKEHDYELIMGFYTELLARRRDKSLEEGILFLLEMYCRGSVYMTVKWVLGGMKKTPGEMAVSLVEAMPPRLSEVFRQAGLV